MYSLDQHGRIGLSEEVEASNDGEAITLLRELKPDPLKCELWDGRRLVAVLKGCDLETEEESRALAFRGEAWTGSPSSR
jgi:hypothetical protein